LVNTFPRQNAQATTEEMLDTCVCWSDCASTYRCYVTAPSRSSRGKEVFLEAISSSQNFSFILSFRLLIAVVGDGDYDDDDDDDDYYYLLLLLYYYYFSDNGCGHPLFLPPIPFSFVCSLKSVHS
jgi:hypothetical protein